MDFSQLSQVLLEISEGHFAKSLWNSQTISDLAQSLLWHLTLTTLEKALLILFFQTATNALGCLSTWFKLRFANKIYKIWYKW